MRWPRPPEQNPLHRKRSHPEIQNDSPRRGDIRDRGRFPILKNRRATTHNNTYACIHNIYYLLKRRRLAILNNDIV